MSSEAPNRPTRPFPDQRFEDCKSRLRHLLPFPESVVHRTDSDNAEPRRDNVGSISLENRPDFGPEPYSGVDDSGSNRTGHARRRPTV